MKRILIPEDDAAAINGSAARQPMNSLLQLVSAVPTSSEKMFAPQNFIPLHARRNLRRMSSPDRVCDWASVLISGSNTLCLLVSLSTDYPTYFPSPALRETWTAAVTTKPTDA
ncbi:hypothetical protein IV203_034878 [Nitzschia inconspicua]|uniref:Uncharacterized protein n=1 Tax=Nitzschia inconspicua TaxID=303405 RepID=A0A9K3LCA4_9STRA|nr:hypothetical protein IV203_034878 [Nitzschia inconspicua]